MREQTDSDDPKHTDGGTPGTFSLGADGKGRFAVRVSGWANHVEYIHIRGERWRKSHTDPLTGTVVFKEP